MLADLGMPFQTFDEIEHEAEPKMPGTKRQIALPVVG